MKKLISTVLALALCVLGCAFAEALDVTGDWYLNVIESEGVQLDLSMLGMEMVITLNADGSAEMSSFGEAEGGTSWRMDGSNVIITDAAGDTLTACPESGNMVIDDQESGVVMILGRERRELQGYVPAAVEDAPAMQDFEGIWNASIVDMMGMQLPMETLGMELVIEIVGENAVVTHTEAGEEVVYSAPLTLAGSVLTVAAVDDQMPMNLQLQQDGKLVCVEETEGLAMNMYFEKIA